MNTPHFSSSMFVLACLGLGGCAAVGPDYTPPPTAEPNAWNRLDATTQPVAHDTAPGDLSQWWLGLDDPLLAELVNEALQASPDLRSAQARLRAARASRTVAAAARFPGVTAAVGAAGRTRLAAAAFGQEPSRGGRTPRANICIRSHGSPVMTMSHELCRKAERYGEPPRVNRGGSVTLEFLLVFPVLFQRLGKPELGIRFYIGRFDCKFIPCFGIRRVVGKTLALSDHINDLCGGSHLSALGAGIRVQK